MEVESMAPSSEDHVHGVNSPSRFVPGRVPGHDSMQNETFQHWRDLAFKCVQPPHWTVRFGVWISVSFAENRGRPATETFTFKQQTKGWNQ